jgi:hypothetical protein
MTNMRTLDTALPILQWRIRTEISTKMVMVATLACLEAPNYRKQMIHTILTYLTARVDTEEMQRLRGGPILGRIIEDMQLKRSGATKREVHFYSGHDTTIAGLLVILGLFDSIQSGHVALFIRL